MSDRKINHEKAESFFEEMWKRGDPWELETSDFEKAKYEQEIRILSGKHYERVLELGCGAGAFTRRLAGVASRILALDVSPTAISRARRLGLGLNGVEFRVQNIMDFKPGTVGPWDLIVINETICYLGWLYTFFDVVWFATELFNATRDGGQLLMANTSGGVDDYLLLPAVIRTYEDAIANVGYQRTSAEVFRGTKNGAQLEVPISLFTRNGEN